MSHDQMEIAVALRPILKMENAKALWIILDEMVAEDTQKLIGIIASRPDTLTGKTAVRLASRAQALRDFKEAVLETQNILPGNQLSTRKGRE